MKSILIIGMGRFGRHLCRNLAKLGNQIMIVDEKEENLEEMLPYVVSAKIGDCTNEAVLKSLGIANFDLCFVCIGTNFQSSLEITSLVKELGGRYVVSKANRDIHAKFLLRNGADHVVYTEKEMAERLAVKYGLDSVFDYIKLTPEYSIYEIQVPPKWIGKTIIQLSVRAKYNVSILATKENGRIRPLPSPDHKFVEQETLLVMGHNDDVAKLMGLKHSML